jgi:RHS repeat-associated protein
MACADCDPSGGGGAGGFYPNDPYLGTARTQSINETGDPGVDLGSQNFNWGLPLVSLPGRSGLDLSVSLYYNSLVWTRQGTVIEFNADHGTPAPGFQLGLPRLQAKYFDSDDNAYAYIMITPSGGRVQMKQTAVAGVYESADSSYTQLTEGSAPVVRTTDGTQFIFGLQVGGGAEWRCTQIKDRNGNFISAEYDAGTGHVTRITDTLARQVNFNYNGNGTLGSITQTQGGTTHTYATFYYAPKTLWLNFSGLLPVGAQSGETRTVLSSVVLSGNLDSYHFEYNSYGQVYQITHKAPDGHELAHTRYNLSDADLGGAAQTDCPRFSAKYDYAQDWNNNQEAVTTFQVTNGVTWTNPETSATESGTLSQQTSPDGTVYKEYSHSSGWGVGLPRLSEVWADADGILTRQKWTSTRWTQDDASLPYPQNPRVEEVNVYDADGNRRRTTIEYNQGYGLPTHVREWGGPNMQTSVRMHATNYNLDLAYTSRRIIGLPFRREVWDANGVQSKYEYHYDYGGNFFEDTPAAATQHDRTNYGPGFITGRGNLADITHYNAKDPDNWAVAQVTRYRYNSAGSLVMVSDPEGHAQYLSFADSFSDGNNSRNTFAYPTKATDADGYFSTAQYNYHFGGVTLTRRPASGTGAGVAYVEEEVLYDQHLRVERVNNLGTGGYKKWVYTPDSKYVHTYETIRSPAAADELHTWQVFDGAGRVRAAASDHPGSQGLFSGQYFMYDRMGRLTQTSNPTEMSAAWSPAGDDAAWVFTTQAYDWMGRPTRTTNPDGTTRILSYGGCGCAGGEATTTQDEHGRKRRLTKDVLGRLSKVEEMNWDGTSVYSTTSYSYNSLDRLTQVDQQGQVRTFNYDGYGRLWKRTTPEQGTTEYAYNGDGTVQWAKDARGAKTKFIYNGRHLPTSIEYDLTGLLSGQSAAATSNVSYTYDAAGHRTQMNDGQGTVTYHYDALGRMDWEERAFTGVGHFRLTYGYNTAGQLSSITNPWGAVVNYGYDLAGRLSSVGGANYAGVSTYVSSTSYRAFGALKGMSFSNGKALSTAYDNRLRPTTWNVSGVLGYNYNYDHFGERTGRVSYAQSLYNSSQDRSYEYDNVGRLIISHSGAEARAATGQGPWGIMDGPFSQGYEYDQWGNMTHRYGWGGEVQGGGAGQTSHLYYSYAGNRRTDHGFTYDNAGNLTFDGGQEFAYDATGQQVSSNYTSLLQGYDGDGLRVKKSEYSAAYTYYLRSSLLGGQVVAEINYQGGWQRGYVYAGQGLLAVQQGGVFFVHEDPVTKSKRVTDMAGALISAVETDPWGADTSASSASAFQPRKFTSYERDANGSDEAMFRRYNRWHSRFDQPDPYDGSYDLTDPQSLNRYAYVRNDPINFVDPAGLDGIPPVHLSIPPNLFPGVGFAATVYGYLGSGSMGGGGRLFAELYVPEESADGPGVTQSGGLTAEQLRERRDRRDKATQCYRDVYTQAARNFRDRRKEAYDRIAQQYPIAPTPAQNKSLGYAVGVTMLWAGARAGLPGAAISGVGTGILGLTAIFVENTHARLSAQWQASAEIRSMRDREIAEGSRNCYEQFGFKRSQLVL